MRRYYTTRVNDSSGENQANAHLMTIVPATKRRRSDASDVFARRRGYPTFQLGTCFDLSSCIRFFLGRMPRAALPWQ
jgi:hypothetical protein